MNVAFGGTISRYAASQVRQVWRKAEPLVKVGDGLISTVDGRERQRRGSFGDGFDPPSLSFTSIITCA